MTKISTTTAETTTETTTTTTTIFRDHHQEYNVFNEEKDGKEKYVGIPSGYQTLFFCSKDLT